MGQRLQQRMPRAQLGLLAQPAKSRRIAVSLHLIPAMAVNDGYGFRRKGLCGIDDVAEQGPAADSMQHLRQRALHPCALTGGQDHDLKA